MIQMCSNPGQHYTPPASGMQESMAPISAHENLRTPSLEGIVFLVPGRCNGASSQQADRSGEGTPPLTDKKLMSFDEALGELQMATRELRDLIAKGEVPVEGEGVELNLRVDDVEKLKNELREKRSSEVPVSVPDSSKGWGQKDGLIVWQGIAPETGWVMTHTAKHDWDRMKFRFYFDACGTLAKVGLAVGRQAFVVETHGNPNKWHSFLMRMDRGTGTIIVDDEERFRGEVQMPFLALCGGGPSQLSETGEDRLAFRGAKLQQLDM